MYIIGLLTLFRITDIVTTNHAKKEKWGVNITMKYIFMHQNIPVSELEMDESTGLIRKVNQVFAPEHLPAGVLVKKDGIDRAALYEWWADRSIPMNRAGVSEAMKELQLSDIRQLVLKSFGLSLSDQYWIKPVGQDLSWEQINFFEHPFSEDVGEALFGVKKQDTAQKTDFVSPDNTTDGYLKKRWKIIDGKRYLLKDGSQPFFQQPFNEVIASELMQRLGVRHVPYTLLWENRKPYSVCEDFLTKDTELVTAWRIMKTQKQANSTSVYQHVRNCCADLGVDVTTDLDQMIVVDYLIANEDRHLNNFGLIRNAKTLEWLGSAPIFDSGSSLGYDKPVWDIKSGWGITCKPFKRHHEKQLQLVTDFDWIDFSKLKDIKEMICETMIAKTEHDYFDERRVMAIADSVENRIQKLKEAAVDTSRKSININAQNATQDDVEKNIAEDYTRKNKEV